LDVASRLDQNPRFRAARAEADRQEAVASVARRSRVPDVDLTFFHDAEIDKTGNSLSASVTLPLWNARRGDIARAEAAAELAAAAVARSRLELSIELASCLKDFEVAVQTVTLLRRELLPRARESARLARLTYEEGESSLLELLDAQRTFRDAEREAVDARAALFAAGCALQRLVGPDFNPWR